MFGHQVEERIKENVDKRIYSYIHKIDCNRCKQIGDQMPKLTGSREEPGNIDESMYIHKINCKR